jgi:WD40 repeat protein
MRRINFFSICSAGAIFFYLAGCSTSTVVGTPTKLMLPATEISTPIPSPTATPLPTPTPGPRAETILKEAGELCNSQKADGPIKTFDEIEIQVPLMTLVNTGSNETEWQYAPFIPYVEAFTADSVKTLVCVWEALKNVGSYDDGSSAMQRLWYVQLVSWPGGELLAADHFEGGDPPISKIADSGPGIGAPPQSDVEAWMMPAARLDDNLLYTSFTPSRLFFSPDGKTLLVSGSQTQKLVWDIENHSANPLVDSVQATQSVAGLNAARSYNLSAPDGSPLVIEFYSTSKAVQDGFGRITSGMLVSDFGPAYEYLSVAVSPDEKWLAAAPQFDMLGPGRHPAAIVWDIGNGTVIANIESENPFYYEHISFSPDGRNLLLTSIPLSQLWDTTTWQLKQEFPNASAAAFSPDGKFLALGFLQGLVDLFSTNGPVLIDLETGEQKVLNGYHESAWVFLVFSPDGKKLASCGSGRFVKLWDIP